MLNKVIVTAIVAASLLVGFGHLASIAAAKTVSRGAIAGLSLTSGIGAIRSGFVFPSVPAVAPVATSIPVDAKTASAAPAKGSPLAVILSRDPSVSLGEKDAALKTVFEGAARVPPVELVQAAAPIESMTTPDPPIETPFVQQFLSEAAKIISVADRNKEIEIFYQKYKSRLNWSQVQLLMSHLKVTYIGTYDKYNTQIRIGVSYLELMSRSLDAATASAIALMTAQKGSPRANKMTEWFFMENKDRLTSSDVETLLSGLQDTHRPGASDRINTGNRILLAWIGRQPR